MLRIAVQSKGRLFKETMKMIEEASIKLTSLGKRKLLVPARNFPVEILYLRDDDIPQAVANGIADVGIVGENEFAEREQDAEIAERLGFSKCRLSIAVPKDEEYTGLECLEGKKIATSYPNVLKSFLKERKINAEVHVITGSVEIAPGIGLSDCILDLVSSGATLLSNNLKEVEIVMHSEAVMIANKELSSYKKTILKELLFRFEAFKEAEDKKYIILNIPNDKIDEVRQILPGMKSPTITPLVE